MPSLITPNLATILHERFHLQWGGAHGAGHWARVRQNGLRLAASSGPGANTRVIELFAFLHDFCRRDEHRDPGHGARAAASLDGLVGDLPALSAEERELLKYACRHHSDGLLDAELTVQICWDADRLDLGRVGFRIEPDRLCTRAAREADVLDWAQARSEKAADYHHRHY
jgi:uncharacterized protein